MQRAGSVTPDAWIQLWGSVTVAYLNHKITQFALLSAFKCCYVCLHRSITITLRDANYTQLDGVLAELVEKENNE